MKVIIVAICAIALSGCDDSKKETKQTPELMFKTEHCRYYCLEKNGFSNCKVSVCECDSGYQSDISISW